MEIQMNINSFIISLFGVISHWSRISYWFLSLFLFDWRTLQRVRIFVFGCNLAWIYIRKLVQKLKSIERRCMLKNSFSWSLGPLRNMSCLISNCLFASMRSNGSLLLKIKRVFLHSLKFIGFCRSIFELSLNVHFELFQLIFYFFFIV